MRKAEILLATYNGEKYVGAQIDSILRQTSDAWHLTVSDDGSTDTTPDILDDYIRRFPDKITRVRSGKKFGKAREHFFWLLQCCEADYIFFCDQDDIWKPDKVERTLDALKGIERVNGADCPAMAFTDLTVVDEDLSPLFDSLMYIQEQDPNIKDYRQLLFKNVVNGNAMAINRPLAKLSLRCTNQQGVLMHDWWIAITAARFGKIAYLPEQTVLYRQHRGNDVGANNEHTPRFLLYKLTHPGILRKSFQDKAKQAGVFLDTFSDSLSEEERAILRGFSTFKMPLKMRWNYLQWIYTPQRKLVFFLVW